MVLGCPPPPSGTNKSKFKLNQKIKITQSLNSLSESLIAQYQIHSQKGFLMVNFNIVHVIFEQYNQIGQNVIPID